MASFSDGGAHGSLIDRARHRDDLAGDIDLDIIDAGDLPDPLREQFGATSADDAGHVEVEGHASPFIWSGA